MSTLYLLVKSLPLKSHPLLTRHFIIYRKLRKLKQNFILKRYIQIRFTDNWKSGMDLMSNKFLKIAKNILAKSLWDIFNASTESKIFPQDFETAKVTPIIKGGITDDVSNYRPISVLSTIARIFEKLLHSHLYEFLTENDILGNRQWGFRSLHSTALALI